MEQQSVEIESLLTNAKEAHANGDLEKADTLYRQILTEEPLHTDTLQLLGVISLQLSNHHEAASLFRRAISQKPNSASLHNNLALTLNGLNSFSEALTACEKAIELDSKFTSAYITLGMIYTATQNYPFAISALQQALAIEPESTDVLLPLAIAAFNMQDYQVCEQSLLKLLSQSPNNIEALLHISKLSILMNKLQDAEIYLTRLIELLPTHVESLTLLGQVFNKQKEFEKAISYLQRAIESDPNIPIAYEEKAYALRYSNQIDKAITLYQEIIDRFGATPTLYFNLANTYFANSELESAIETFKLAIKEPDCLINSYSTLGCALANIPDYNAAITYFQIAKSKKYNGNPQIRPSAGIGIFQVKHDLEQLQYLIDKNLLEGDYTEYYDTLSLLWGQYQNHGALNYLISLDENQQKIIRSNTHSILFETDAPLVETSPINPNLDVTKIQSEYHSKFPELVVIDDILTSEALNSMRQYCLESTVWKQPYYNGYLGAMANESFSCPLLLQIAYELRKTFPEIFKDDLLYYAWAFKYDSTMKGINVHADFARVNVNLWITPSESCLDMTSGGLVLWDKVSPRSWAFTDYNNNSKKIMAYLDQEKANSITVPYKANRIVIFNSSVFHKTDTLHFKDNYEDRRINITFLYGQGLQ